MKDVLANIDKYDWSYALFLPEDEVWELQTKCAILDPDDVEDDADEAPRYAIDNNLIALYLSKIYRELPKMYVSRNRITMKKIYWKPFYIILIMMHLSNLQIDAS